MAYFDLNVPYNSASPSSDEAKSNRIKIATKAMELGYDGVAYNRTMRGVMSDQDRCTIAPLSLSSLLKVAPSLSASVSLHRQLLGLPTPTSSSAAFRQYTRLTVVAETVSQAQVLNRGNPVLKSYDLVAVRPMNQAVFDHACEKSEVDMIAVDFSEKLPFRLKLPLVKAAIERGVYFEITYSNLIKDTWIRRQVISTAKLLVDWTRGKSLIISSGASSVNEIRGPLDVANLSTLLGISMERAKASISKNCRILVANALKKKHFYKETIRIEALSSSERMDSVDLWSSELLNWDPISSGDGDLLLDDLKNSFSITNNVSKIAKPIDFVSIIESMPSNGFQVEDLTCASHEKKAAEVDDGRNSESDSGIHNALPKVNATSESGQLTVSSSLPELHHSSFSNNSLVCQISNAEVPEEPVLLGEAMDAEEDRGQSGSTNDVCVNTHGFKGHDDSSSVDLVGLESVKSVLSNSTDADLGPPMSDISLSAACNIGGEFVASTPSVVSPILPDPLKEGGTQQSKGFTDQNDDPCQKDQESSELKGSNAYLNEYSPSNEQTMIKADLSPKEVLPAVSVSLRLCQQESETMQMRELKDGTALHEEGMGSTRCDDQEKDNEEPKIYEAQEDVVMEVQALVKEDVELPQSNLNLTMAEEVRARQKVTHRSIVFPLKRLLSPVSFKKKAQKVRRKI